MLICFLCMAQKSHTHTHIHTHTQIMELRNASFFEDVFLCRSKDEVSSLKRTFETIVGNSQDLEPKEEVEVEPRRNKRAMIEKSFGNEKGY